MYRTAIFPQSGLRLYKNKQTCKTQYTVLPPISVNLSPGTKKYHVLLKIASELAGKI